MSGVAFMLNNTIISLIYMFFALKTLNAKLNTITCFLLFAMLSTLLHATYLIDIEIFRTVYALGPILLFFIFILFIFENKLKEKLLFFATVFGIFLVLSVLIDTIGVMLGLSIENNFHVFIFSTVFGTSYIACLLFFSRFFKKNIKTVIFNKNLWMFVAFPLTQFFLLFTMSMIISYARIMGSENAFEPLITSEMILKILIIISIIFSVVTDISFLLIMIKNANHTKLQEKLRLENTKSEFQLEYYQALEKSAEEIRKIRHDFGNILQTVSALQCHNDTRSKLQAEKLFESLQHMIEKLDESHKIDF